jgi:AcrR family transcriptional regulator
MADLPMANPTEPFELPVVAAPAERADAARNRARILSAAEHLFAANGGCTEVSMDAIATAAGVGKGTLFRRFGDRAGLMRALLDESETAFQEAVIRGEPPLGPGAPAAERLAAFGRGRFELLDRHGAMIASAEAGERGLARFSSPVYLFYRAHIGMLVRDCGTNLDADYVTEALLAPLAADLFMYQRNALEMDLDRIVEGYTGLIRRLLG